ncbi:MAG: type II secretion system protein GspC [Gammaproteobacteria bacterium]
MSPADVQAAATEHLPGITSVVLVLCIAYYLAKLIWLLVPGGSTDELLIAADAATSGGRGATSIDYDAIVNAHVFGESTGEAPPPKAVIDAPETRLNLKLRGAIAAEDESVAHAIIAEGNGKETVYFLQDAVPGGAKLHEVQADRVILNRGGVLEALRLPKETSGKSAQATRAPPPARQMPPDVQEMLRSGGAAAGGGGGPPAAFTDILRPQPFMPNGQMKGYRVYPGRDRKKFAALGLRAGDLVTEINGQPLDNLNAGMEIFRNLANVSQLNVVVERNGQPLVLNLNTADLTGDGALK